MIFKVYTLHRRKFRYFGLNDRKLLKKLSVIMAGVLDTVNQRTNLVGRNRMELLLFKLTSKQIYGINVFKIREVSECPKLRSVPHSHKHVKGIFDFRDSPIMVIDISAAMGGPDLDPENSLLIVTEYNQTVQGLLVENVDKIVNLGWENVEPPPAGINGSYLTAVAKDNDVMIEILDVEKVLWSIQPQNMDLKKMHELSLCKGKRAIILDDSNLARQHLIKILENIDMTVEAFNNGQDALDFIKKYLDDNPGDLLKDRYSLIISDIEMPLLDGYTFCSEIKNDQRCAKVPVILHTSLSGHFNDSLVKRVKADFFVKKFDPDEIVTSIEEALKPK